MARTVLLLALALGCSGAAADLEEALEAAAAAGELDAAPDAGPEPGCGLSFDEAVRRHAPERVCQTTVYDRVSGYCTFWQPCSEL